MAYFTNVAQNVILIWPSTNASIPSGFSRETGLDDKYPKGNAAGIDPGVTGGVLTHSHTTASHNHTTAHTHTTPDSGAGSGTTARDASNTNPADTHTHVSNPNTVNPTTNLAGDTPSTSTDSHEPAFFKVIFIKSDGTPTGVPANAVGIWGSTTLPTNWNLCDGGSGRPDMRNRVLKGAATGADGGSTGGSDTHTHTINSHTHSTPYAHTHPNVTSSQTASGLPAGTVSGSQAGTATATHTHAMTIASGSPAITGNTDSAASDSSLPPYVVPGFIQNNGSGADLPDRMIGLWGGTLATIPPFWYLCDGTNGTPDYRDKFLRCANTAGGIGGAGGGSLTHGSTHTTTGHTHAVASHLHSVTGAAGAGENRTAGSTNAATTAHTHGWGNTSSQSFTSGSNSPTVNNYTDTEPPFKTVAYIQYQQPQPGTDSPRSIVSGFGCGLAAAAMFTTLMTAWSTAPVMVQAPATAVYGSEYQPNAKVEIATPAQMFNALLPGWASGTIPRQGFVFDTGYEPRAQFEPYNVRVGLRNFLQPGWETNWIPRQNFLYDGGFIPYGDVKPYNIPASIRNWLQPGWETNYNPRPAVIWDGGFVPYGDVKPYPVNALWTTLAPAFSPAFAFSIGFPGSDQIIQTRWDPHLKPALQAATLLPAWSNTPELNFALLQGSDYRHDLRPFPDQFNGRFGQFLLDNTAYNPRPALVWDGGFIPWGRFEPYNIPALYTRLVPTFNAHFGFPFWAYSEERPIQTSWQTTLDPVKQANLLTAITATAYNPRPSVIYGDHYQPVVLTNLYSAKYGLLLPQDGLIFTPPAGQAMYGGEYFPGARFRFPKISIGPTGGQQTTPALPGLMYGGEYLPRQTWNYGFYTSAFWIDGAFAEPLLITDGGYIPRSQFKPYNIAAHYQISVPHWTSGLPQAPQVFVTFGLDFIPRSTFTHPNPSLLRSVLAQGEQSTFIPRQSFVIDTGYTPWSQFTPYNIAGQFSLQVPQWTSPLAQQPIIFAPPDLSFIPQSAFTNPNPALLRAVLQASEQTVFEPHQGFVIDAGYQPRAQFQPYNIPGGLAIFMQAWASGFPPSIVTPTAKTVHSGRRWRRAWGS